MKFKRLIPALAMLLVSAILLGTSTFAWFSMNTTVSATNMQITAKSDSVFLLISNTNTTASDIQAENATTVAETVAAADAKVYPSAYENINTAADFATVGNWYTAAAQQPTASTMKADTKASLNADDESDATVHDFSNYVIKKTYYFTLAAGSNAAQNLVVSKVSKTMNNTAHGSAETNAAMKIVVVGTNYVEFANTDNDGDATVLAASLTDSTVVSVDVYIYFDGNDTSVYTNNVANLEGAQFDLEFSVTPVA